MSTLVDAANALQWHLAPLYAAVINLATNHLEAVVSSKQFDFVPEMNWKTCFTYAPWKTSVPQRFNIVGCQKSLNVLWGTKSSIVADLNLFGKRFYEQQSDDYKIYKETLA